MVVTTVNHDPVKCRALRDSQRIHWIIGRGSQYGRPETDCLIGEGRITHQVYRLYNDWPSYGGWEAQVDGLPFAKDGIVLLGEVLEACDQREYDHDNGAIG